MRSRRRWRSGIVVTVTITSALALAINAPAYAEPQPASEKPVAGSAGNVSAPAAVSAEAWAAGRAKYGATATAAQAIESYWTPERMRSATPIEDSPAYLAAIKKYDKDVKAAKERARRSPEQSKPVPATPHQVAPRGGAVETPAVTPSAYDPGYAYWHPTARTSGKVFFNLGVGRFVCSGTIVNSEGQDTVWTAGHCVPRRRQRRLGDELGVRARRSTTTWPTRARTARGTRSQLWTRTAWSEQLRLRQDMGVAIMGTKFGGYHIVDYLGGQGITVNVGKRRLGERVRIPGGVARSTAATCTAAGAHLARVGRSCRVGSETIKIPCDMTRGSSGGGWLLRLGRQLGLPQRRQQPDRPHRQPDDHALAVLRRHGVGSLQHDPIPLTQDGCRPPGRHPLSSCSFLRAELLNQSRIRQILWPHRRASRPARRRGPRGSRSGPCRRWPGCGRRGRTRARGPVGCGR